MDKEQLGHYQLKSELGRGGMGVVYKAYDPTLSRDVAIKVLAESLAHDTGVVERFMREARSMAALNDAHIIQIYFIGDDQGQPYFVMEFVEGESLSQRLKRDGKVVTSEACRIIRETAEGLALAHSKGVIHRDIKPGNLMLTTRDKVKIADFGIAMVQDYSERLTNTGEFVGTPGYLSPEVCVGQPVDHRSDIFALGIVFFEMLTGRIPFTESSPLGMMLEVVKADIPDVRSINAEVDERTCNILKRMITKDPAQRYQSCEELIVDLAGHQPVSAPGGPQPVAGGSEFQQAATTALSQLEALPELADQVRSAPPPAPVGSSPQPAAAGSSNKAVPIAIAAALILSIGAGSVYLFRDALFGEAEKPRVALTNLKTEPLKVDESAQIAVQQADPITRVSSDDQIDSAAGDSELISDADLDAEIQRLAAATDQADPASVTKQSVANPVAITPAESAMTREVAEPVASSPPPVQLAKATVTPEPKRIEPPPPPREPRVVVVAVGDRAIAGPVEQMLEDALTEADQIVLDEGFFSGIGSVANERGVDLAGLSDLLTHNGVDILVLAEVDYLGESLLQYYGQVSTLYSVQLKVRNIVLSERRPVGRGLSQKVDFTNLNANEKAREAVTPYLSQMTAALAALENG